MPVALRQKIATSLSWLHERHSKGFVRAHKVIVRPPPLEMSQQVWGLLCGGPGTSCQSCYAMTDREIHPLNESGIQLSREAHFLQAGLESGLCQEAHHVRDANQLAPPLAFFHLTVDQTIRHLPSTHVASSTAKRQPLTKVGGERIEVQV